MIPKHLGEDLSHPIKTKLVKAQLAIAIEFLEHLSTDWDFGKDLPSILSEEATRVLVKIVALNNTFE